MSDFSEKRRFKRIDMKVPLKYKELRSKSPSSKAALSKNLSEGGVKFNAEKFISLSCRMVLELNIPTLSKPLRAISKVAWIRKLTSDDLYEIGNQFLDMSKEDKNAIAEFIKSTA